MNFNRVVIKVGSALISPDAKGCNGKHVLPIARFITECHHQGKEVVLVSSGSVAAGREHISEKTSHATITLKQAMASVGQMKMMANWQRFFDIACGQVLITHGDLKDPERYLNIKSTIELLLKNGALPVINENDTVATEELKVGDNDNLAALVAEVSGADCLIILSDIDGLYTGDPRSDSNAVKLTTVDNITEEVYAMGGDTQNPLATGGMKTKIQAADKATNKGIETYIVHGGQGDTFEQLLKGANPGTHFKRKH